MGLKPGYVFVVFVFNGINPVAILKYVLCEFVQRPEGRCYVNLFNGVNVVAMDMIFNEDVNTVAMGMH